MDEAISGAHGLVSMPTWDVGTRVSLPTSSQKLMEHTLVPHMHTWLGKAF